MTLRWPDGTVLSTTEVVPVQVRKADWYESQHPRHPAGTSEGGEFATGGADHGHIYRSAASQDVRTVLRGWGRGNSDMRHAVMSRLLGQARKDYVCYDCDGPDGERWDRAGEILALI